MPATGWVYKRSEPQLWTVGYYDPQGHWHPESDWSRPERAAAQVNYLNGGTSERPAPDDWHIASDD